MLTVYYSKLPGFGDCLVLVSCGYTADVGSRYVSTVYEIPLLASFIPTILNIDIKTHWKYLSSQFVDDKKISTCKLDPDLKVNTKMFCHLLFESVKNTTWFQVLVHFEDQWQEKNGSYLLIAIQEKERHKGEQLRD